MRQNKKALLLNSYQNEFNRSVFIMKRVSYSSEVKWECIELKTAGLSTKEIMDELNIRNKTQVETLVEMV